MEEKTYLILFLGSKKRKSLNKEHNLGSKQSVVLD